MRSSRGGTQLGGSILVSRDPFRVGFFGRAFFPRTNLRTGAVFWRSFLARCPPAGTEKPHPGDGKPLVNGRRPTRNTAIKSAGIFGNTPLQKPITQVYGGISGEPPVPLHTANPYRKTNSSNFLTVWRLRNEAGEESEVYDSTSYTTTINTNEVKPKTEYEMFNPNLTR